MKVSRATCNHTYPDGKSALRVVGGFIYEDLKCDLCRGKFNEIDFHDGPVGADPFGSYPRLDPPLRTA